MMRESLISKNNKLLSFRHEEVIIYNLEGVLQFLCMETLLFQAPVFEYTAGKVETLVPSTMIDT